MNGHTYRITSPTLSEGLGGFCRTRSLEWYKNRITTDAWPTHAVTWSLLGNTTMSKALEWECEQLGVARSIGVVYGWDNDAYVIATQNLGVTCSTDLNGLHVSQVLDLARCLNGSVPKEFYTSGGYAGGQPTSTHRNERTASFSQRHGS